MDESGKAATFDPVAIEEHKRAFLKALPDQDLAQELDGLITAKTKAKLRQSDGPPLETLTADEILTTDWPEPVWSVPGLLPSGLAILAGKAKVGKSWLALQIAQAVAAGGVALGERVTAGPVLYLALEDTPRRLRDRMTKQGWSAGLPCDFMALGEFYDQVGDLRNGGGEILARQIKHGGHRLVVIDTLGRSVGGDHNDYTDMTLALAPLQEIAHNNNCTALLIDHHNKMAGGDALTDILGTTAKGAMVDTALGLYRERGKAGAKLSVVGRDVDEKNLELTMDWLTGCWQVEVGSDGVNLTDNQAEMLDVLEAIGPAGCVDIAKALDRDKGNTYKDLADLVNRGLVSKAGKGRGNVKYEVAQLSQPLQL